MSSKHTLSYNLSAFRAMKQQIQKFTDGILHLHEYIQIQFKTRAQNNLNQNEEFEKPTNLAATVDRKQESKTKSNDKQLYMVRQTIIGKANISINQELK